MIEGYHPTKKTSPTKENDQGEKNMNPKKEKKEVETPLQFVINSCKKIEDQLQNPCYSDPEQYASQDLKSWKSLLKEQEESVAVMKAFLDAITTEPTEKPANSVEEFETEEEYRAWIFDLQVAEELFLQEARAKNYSPEQFPQLKQELIETVEGQRNVLHDIAIKLQQAEAKVKEAEAKEQEARKAIAEAEAKEQEAHRARAEAEAKEQEAHKARAEAEAKEQEERKAREMAEDKLKSRIVNSIPNSSPSTYYIPNAKTSQVFYGLEPAQDKHGALLQSSHYEVDVTKRGNHAPVYAYFSLLFPTDETGTVIDNKLNQFDRSVMNAVSTIYQHGVQTFTIQQVVNCMKGFKGKSREEFSNVVEKSIDRMRFIEITLNYTEQMEKHYNQTGEFIHNSYAIMATKTSVIYKNNKVIQYELKEPPVLYRHAQATKQVLSFPTSVIDIHHIAKMNDTAIMIRDSLLVRLGQAHANNGEIFKFLELFDSLGLQDLSRKQKFGYIDTVKKILDHFKMEGILIDYNILNNGKSVDGFDLIVPPKKHLKK